MVLEKLISLRAALKNPLLVFVIGGIVSVICLLISFLVFETSVGLFFTFLVTIAMMPFMVNLVKYEEARQEELIIRGKERSLLQRNRDILKVYIAFFCGMIFALSLLFMILPEKTVERLFDDQIREIEMIRGKVIFGDTFLTIVTNNISVLILSFLFSFLFGAGAIFILTWNSSILSTAIGLTAKSIGGFRALPLAVLVFFPHGSLEILAYFIGGIAGGFVSAAVTRRKSLGFWFIVRDSLFLMIFSVLLLIVAGFIEAIAIVV